MWVSISFRRASAGQTGAPHGVVRACPPLATALTVVIVSEAGSRTPRRSSWSSSRFVRAPGSSGVRPRPHHRQRHSLGIQSCFETETLEPSAMVATDSSRESELAEGMEWSPGARAIKNCPEVISPPSQILSGVGKDQVCATRVVSVAGPSKSVTCPRPDWRPLTNRRPCREPAGIADGLERGWRPTVWCGRWWC